MLENTRGNKQQMMDRIPCQKSYSYKDMLKKKLYILFVFLGTLNAYPKVKLSKVFSDNMVLQQSAKITMSGEGKPNSKIKIVTGWESSYKLKTDKAGFFTAEIETPKAGGPYNIKIDDGDIVELKNILIGEVWIASGQSNMEMKVKGYDAKQPVLNKEAFVKHASSKPAIRFLTLDRTPAEEPQQDVKGLWEQTNASTVLEFSAIAYEFASKLHTELNVPIGIIVAANSGTRIESWMSKKALESINDRLLMLNVPFSKNSPSTMYNTMIVPLTDFKIRGVIWYQGEANRMSPGAYLKQFPALVNNWRKDWKDENLPFYTVEIAPYTYPTDKDRAYITAFFRENQRKLSKLVNNTGIVSTVDVGSESTVHPPDKTKVGNRLALLALTKTYLVKNTPNESIYKSFKTGGNKIFIEFTNANKLRVDGQYVNDIEIAGEDQVFYPADTQVEGDKLAVWSEKVQEPKSVRYCFKAYSKGNFYNQNGLPIPPFRTDNWSIVQKK